MNEITDRQEKILRFITEYIRENKFSPTLREIAEHFQITVKAVKDHKLALEKKGYIKSLYKKARTITIKETP